MTAADRRRESRIPAGYTYLGQFVDHDLTFDKTAVRLGERVTPAQLVQARSPSLDLDSLYGAGPQDPVSARFYGDDVHLKMGRTAAIGPDAAKQGFDLPRRASGPAARAQGGHPRPAQRREPRGRPDPPRVDPLPQPGRRHAALVGAARAALRQRRARSSSSTTSGCSATTTCPGSATPASSPTCFSERRKAFEVGAHPDRRPDHADRVLRRRLSARAQHGPATNTAGTGASTSAAARSTSSSTFSGLSGDLGGGPRLPSNWIADFRRLYDSGESRPGRPGRASGEVQPRRADRHASPCGRSRSLAVSFRRRRDAREPRASRPAAGEDVSLATCPQLARFLPARASS